MINALLFISAFVVALRLENQVLGKFSITIQRLDALYNIARV